MPVTLPGSLFDELVLALEPLAAADPVPQLSRWPGEAAMNAPHVLSYLQHASSGVHAVFADEEEPGGERKTRLMALDDVVVLDLAGEDEARAWDMLRNAERLTGMSVASAT